MIDLPKIDPDLLSPAEKLAMLPPLEKAKFLKNFTDSELAALQYKWRGFLARPKQLLPDGIWTFLLISAGRGFGKAFDNDTPCPTPTGWVKLKDIQLGDIVFDEAGKSCRVLDIFNVFPDKAYRLTFSDGTYLDACEDHQWVTWTHADRKAFIRSQYEISNKFPPNWTEWRSKRRRRGENDPKIHNDSLGPRIRTTNDIINTFTHGKRGDTNHCIPVCGSLELPHLLLQLDPYVLGAWLGDGSKADGTIAAHELDQAFMRKQFELVGIRTTTLSNTQAFGTLGFRTKLNQLNVLNNKHVPEIYLRSSEQQRLALLQGLMDTDGCISKSGSSVEFCNTNKRLIDAVIELARSLGQKPVVSEGRSTLYGEDKGPKWRVTWRPTKPVFRMPRKLERLQLDSTSQSLRNHHRMIVDFKEIDPVPMRCLTVDSKSSMFLIGDGMIPTHNTRTGSEAVREVVENGTARRILIAGPTAESIRNVMLIGDSGLLSIFPPKDMPKYEPSKSTIRFKNGAIAFLVSADEPERFRGYQCDFAWADELSAWRYPDSFDQLRMGMRLGVNPRCIITTTPKPTALIRELIKQARDPDSPVKVKLVEGSTFENLNLPPEFFREMTAKYGNTRLGLQELYAKVLEDIEGALWNATILEAGRVSDLPCPLKRIVVAIDPAVTTGDKSDETGIIVAGLGEDNHGYLLADLSGKYSPHVWAVKAIRAYHKYKADRIIAEVNNGGELVGSNLRTVDASVPFKAVSASKGKRVRAEPISALYEQKRIHHVGIFSELETQLCVWDPIGDTKSPDRLDATVWAFTELMMTGKPRRDLSLFKNWI